jgi:integrase
LESDFRDAQRAIPPAVQENAAVQTYRTIQLMLGHADIKQTQRYLNITDEELRKAMTGVWERRRQLKAVGQ